MRNWWSEDRAFTSEPNIGITPEFRERLGALHKLADEFGCLAGSHRDLDIIAYRIALNLPLDGSWRQPMPGHFAEGEE